MHHRAPAGQGHTGPARPRLLSRIASGRADPTTVLTRQQDMTSVLDAYAAFDRRDPGWTKVTLKVSG